MNTGDRFRYSPNMSHCMAEPTRLISFIAKYLFKGRMYLIVVWASDIYAARVYCTAHGLHLQYL